MNLMINILNSYVALASVRTDNAEGFVFGLTKEGLIIVSVALIALLVAAFFIGRVSKQAPAVEEKTISHPNAVPTVDGSGDKQLVAVITAAIMAMRDEEARANGTEAVGFKVVSFKRSERR